MKHVANKNEQIARRMPPVVVMPRSQGVYRRMHAFLLQDPWDKALRAVCGVSLRVKGIPMHCVTFLASQSAMPLSRPCGTC